MSETGEAIKTIFNTMPERLNATAAGDLDCVIQYDLTGEDGGSHYTTIKDGVCAVSDGGHDAPTMTITISASDFVDMTEGRLDGMSAFMSGRLKVGGDMGLAMQLQNLFS